MDASLERDLGVARQRQTLPHRAHETRKIGIRERGRRTAAEEHRLKRRPLYIGGLRRRVELLQEHVDIAMRRFFLRIVLEKSAVAAFLIAERDVDVRRALVGGIGRLRHELRPRLRLLHFVHDHALAARTGMHDALFRKGAAERILRLRAEQPAARLRGDLHEFCL